MVHVGVLGAGAIGAYVGARICSANASQTDLRVTLVGRQSLLSDVRAANDVVRTIGLGGKPGTCQCGAVGAPGLAVTDDVSALRDAEIILVAVKSGQTAEAMAQLIPVLAGGPPRTIVSLQNGVRNPSVMREALGPDSPHRVLAGMVGFNVVWRDHAVFAQSTGGEIYLQEGGQSALLARLAGNGGIKVVVQRDVTPISYGKLIINLTNACNALSGVPVQQMLKDMSMRRALAMCMNEAIDVFTRAGIPLKSPRATVHTMPRLLSLPDCVFRLIQPLVIKIDAQAKASMLQDVEKKRPTEIEYLNGEVLRVAQERGFKEPPVNAAMVRLIRETEERAQGSPVMDGADLWQRLRNAQMQASSKD